jgi:predicted ATPase/class 3 adenylate cyclase
LSDVDRWLAGLGLERYGPAFSEAEIEFSDLRQLSAEDLKELGLPLGPRRRIQEAIKQLNGAEPSPAAAPATPAPATAAPETPAPRQAAATPSEAERRQLTVMFVDLVGSTEMAAKVDPEDLRAIVRAYQKTAEAVIQRHGGHIAQYLGDGLLVYFGYPAAHEDDAARAVYAGVGIPKAVDALNTRLETDYSVRLSVRIGIHTGPVVVGEMGGGGRHENLAMGETPNLAARLQALAEPGAVVISENTRRILGELFALTPLGAQRLKGISEAVEAYAVIAETARESRFDARQLGMLTPIVGREQELGLMRERWVSAKAGSGQMIVVSGEAGIGKSRVTRALVDAIAQEDHVRLTFQCSPNHTDSAFYPIIQQLTHAAGIRPTDVPAERLDKLERLAGIEVGSAALMAALLGIDAGGRYAPLDLTPAQQRARTMQALVRLIVRQARERPLLAVFEDLHWVDPTTLELLDLALDAIAEEKVLLLATARPSFEHGFGGHPIVTRFALNRLGKDQILAIVDKLTEGRSLPDEVLRVIARRTDGVPLFVEELTKTILESGVLKPDGDRLVLDGPLDALAIPSTLHDSLMARLDRLQPIKEVAQTAACIGREFDHRLLAKVAPLPAAALDTALEGLIKAELIYRRGLPPEATYLFKHALVRDAAYESLLKERRRSIHGRILTALEKAPDTAPEVLAYHAEAAGQTKHAIDLWEAASKAAIARPAFDEGISHLARAIALIAPQTESGDQAAMQHALSLQVQLGVASMARKGWGADETKAAFERALVLADRIGETPLRFSILYGLNTGRYLRSETAEAVRHGEALVLLAEQAPQTAPAVVANRSYAITLTLVGRPRDAQTYFERALALFDPQMHKGLEKQYGQDLGVGSHCFLAVNLDYLGQTRRARDMAREGERYAMASGHAHSICYMHLSMMLRVLWGALRDEAELERHARALAALSGEHNLVLYRLLASAALTLVAAGKGEPAGIADYLKADAAVLATNNKMGMSAMRVEAGWRARALGLGEQARALAAKARELCEDTGEAMGLPELHRLEGALALDAGDDQGAEACLKAAIDLASGQGNLLFELRAAIDLARHWHSMGRSVEAAALLRPVVASIAEGDCATDRETAQAMLAEFGT